MSLSWLLPIQEFGTVIDEIVDYSKEKFEKKYKSNPFDIVVDGVGGTHCPCLTGAVPSQTVQ